MRLKKAASCARIRAVSSAVVLAKPNASEASPSPSSPPSVLSRTISQTVRDVARTDRSSMPVTRSCGMAVARKGSSTDANTVPAAAASTSRRLWVIEVPSALHDDRLADLAQREPVMLADERFLNPFDRFHEGL